MDLLLHFVLFSFIKVSSLFNSFLKMFLSVVMKPSRTSNFIGPVYHAALLFSRLVSVVCSVVSSANQRRPINSFVL